MRMRTLVLVVVVAVALCTAAECDRILSFDDVPSGTDLRGSSLYKDIHRVLFAGSFQATDHIDWPWGQPASGTNVMTLAAVPPGSYPRVLFGYYSASSAEMDLATAVGGFFSTDRGVMVRITAYRWVEGLPYSVPVSTAIVGALGDSWDNRYVQLISPEAPFFLLAFEGVNSPNDLLGFCMDDMTITYVPEPSSLLALCAGIGAMGGLIRRRRG